MISIYNKSWQLTLLETFSLRLAPTNFISLFFFGGVFSKLSFRLKDSLDYCSSSSKDLWIVLVIRLYPCVRQISLSSSDPHWISRWFLVSSQVSIEGNHGKLSASWISSSWKEQATWCIWALPENSQVFDQGLG
jgi:hypothetical protein